MRNNQDSNGSDMYSMFENAIVFNAYICGWVTSSVTNMRYMFDGAVTFNPINHLVQVLY